MKNRVYFFGAGPIGRQALERNRAEVDVVGFLDNDTEKYGTRIDGVEVFPPASIRMEEVDLVVITSSAELEIFEQLVEMGIEKQHIRIFRSASEAPLGWEPPSVLPPEFYAELDSADVAGATAVTAEFLNRYVEAMGYHPELGTIRQHKRLSMLSEQVLLLLRYMAIGAKGRVLEIGAYVGGSTLALASGIDRAEKAPLISIESGEGYEGYSEIPSQDVFGDLTRNVERAGYGERVILLKGRSDDAEVVRKVREEVGAEEIGLLFIDADGELERDLRIYGPSLRDDCLVVLDDYLSDVALEKAGKVRAWVDRQVTSGMLEPLGLFPWGTWCGRIRGKWPQ